VIINVAGPIIGRVFLAASCPCQAFFLRRTTSTRATWLGASVAVTGLMSIYKFLEAAHIKDVTFARRKVPFVKYGGLRAFNLS
jgi:hypothetical protein